MEVNVQDENDVMRMIAWHILWKDDNQGKTVNESRAEFRQEVIDFASKINPKYMENASAAYRQRERERLLGIDRIDGVEVNSVDPLGGEDDVT